MIERQIEMRDIYREIESGQKERYICRYVDIQICRYTDIQIIRYISRYLDIQIDPIDIQKVMWHCYQRPRLKDLS